MAHIHRPGVSDFWDGTWTGAGLHLVAGCVSTVVIGSLVVSAAVFINRQVVQRRALLIRWGRKTQDKLCIPEHLCVFAATDPGMSDKGLQLALESVFLAGVYASVGLSLFFTKQVRNGFDFWLRNTVSLFFGVVIPACILLVMWLRLVRAKDRLVAAARRGVNINDEERPRLQDSLLIAGRSMELFAKSYDDLIIALQADRLGEKAATPSQPTDSKPDEKTTAPGPEEVRYPVFCI